MNQSGEDEILYSEKTHNLHRRVLFQSAAALLGGCAVALGLPVRAVDANASLGASPGESVIAGDGVAVVATTAGKVAGYIHNGIATFKGIPYGDTTEGGNRFMPPAKPKPWGGVRSSRYYGYVAPQARRAGWANDEEAFMFSWDDGTQSEDCLRINIWTPGINDGKKRPVMVWLHGGGFAAGSGHELPSYYGENLSRRGDVVLVSLNHRLNALGFLDLSRYGERYASSGNVGMLDIVAALEWIRDNIHGFGGDSGLVTIFGQSGGGGKVSMLMGMPAAKGLFHRAIVESGSMMRAAMQVKSQQLADLVIKELGLNSSSIDQIHSIPYQHLVEAGQKVLKEQWPMPPGGVPDIRRMAEFLGFAPVVDGAILPAHPFSPQASQLSADVPMIIGTTLNEFVTALNHPELEAMTESELKQHVTAMFGSNADQIIATFRRRSPAAKPFDLWSRIAAAPVRAAAIEQAKAKAAQGNGASYLYWFTWQTPVLGGRPRAIHCAEIAFVFDNTDRCETMTGGGAVARKLGGIMSDAWIAFARSGNPNHPRQPHWPAFSAEQIPTMVFDDSLRMLNNPDGEEQRSVAED